METKLRSLYGKYGYTPFKMSKFEEYNFYSRNKGIIVSEGVITFTDTNGKLMALKPDVTLSIVKNYRNGTEGVQRLYYNENVYRISEKTGSYKEIHQMGLECMGKINDYNVHEVVRLAALSLSRLSSGSVLNISNLDILSAILQNLEPGEWQRQLLVCIGDKNAHGIRRICRERGVRDEDEELLTALTRSYGSCQKVIDDIKSITMRNDIIAALRRIEDIMTSVEDIHDVKVSVDLSLVKDMEYYNGIVFQGFVQGLPAGVLSGGQYDCLMRKMEKDAGAMGFAVYLDPLERLSTEGQFDVDVLLVYKSEDNEKEVLAKAAQLVRDGKTVSVQTCIPARFSYGELIEFGKE